MDLKTFKDIALKSEIRQEAIKWIKEIEDCKDSYCLTCMKQEALNCDKNQHIVLAENDPYEPYHTDGAVMWIKHFFNITDEDLK